MNRLEAIRCVESVYRLGNAETWLARVTDSLERIVQPKDGIGGYLMQVTDEGLKVSHGVERDHHPEFKFVRALDGTHSRYVEHIFPPAPLCTSGSELAASAGFDDFSDDAVDVLGPFRDVFALSAGNYVGSGVVFFSPERNTVAVPARDRKFLLNLTSHVAVADRLRRKFGRPSTANADAVFSPDGRVLHASGSAKENLCTLARQIAAQKSAAELLKREEPDEALSIWRGLVAGRWSLVEVAEADGKRFLVAHEHVFGSLDPRALTSREKSVAHRVAKGHANAVIGYDLSISIPTVATHLRNVLSKLKLADRTELIRIGPEVFELS